MPDYRRPSGPNRGPNRGPNWGPNRGPDRGSSGGPDRRPPGGPPRRPSRPDGPTTRIGATKPPRREQPDLPPEAIVYQDDAIIVVDKPAGLPVRVPVRGRPEPDLIHAVAKLLDLSPRKPQLWPADELDTEAAGLVAFAKRPAAADALRTEFKRNRVHRVMLAVTEGVPGIAEDETAADTSDAFVTHQSMLSPGPDGKTQSEPGGFRGGVRPADVAEEDKGRTASTGPHASTSHIKVERSTEKRAVVRVRLESAFPHQERVHLADLGTPIVGDRRYGFPPPDGSRPPAGLMLQRAELGFTHPSTQKKVRYKLPEPVLFARMLGEKTEAAKADNSWEPVADWYQGLVGSGQSDHHEELILPGVLELLGNVANARILDIACGQGVLARALASHGAKVTGIDASPTLIEAASKTAGSTETYTVGDVRDLHGAIGDAELFDGAACVLAAMNIDPFAPVLEGAAALLRPGAPLVLVVMHPAFRIPKATDWQWDDSTGRMTQHRRVTAYMGHRAEPIVMNPGAVASGADAITTTTHHRPISFYINALGESGFSADRFEEWSSKRESEPGPRADAENTARREIPMFLAIRARRL